MKTIDKINLFLNPETNKTEIKNNKRFFKEKISKYATTYVYYIGVFPIGKVYINQGKWTTTLGFKKDFHSSKEIAMKFLEELCYKEYPIK